MKSDRFRALLKQLSVLTNFWPAVLVVLAVGFALPRTIPVLKTLPERLILTEVNAAEEKPALPDPEEETEEKIEDSGNTYEDGVYTGSSSGYGGKVTVQVTVKEHKITDVSVLSAPGETAEFLAKAKGVISRVLQAQTWEVDVVSGATYSSRGILGAIRNALTGETVENEAPPEKEGPVAPIKKVPFDDNVKWKDGVYIGSAQGYGGTIKVEVTIRQAKIAAIRVLDHSHESDSYFNKAKKVINRIIKAGTPNVDTISGATYSSNGIINAVKNALKKAAGDSSADTGNPAQNPPKNPAQDDGADQEDPNLENGLKDGTYTTDVVCTDNNIFEYTIRLTMLVKNGRITSLKAVRIKDQSDNPDMNATYLGYAVSGRKDGGKTMPGVIAQILKLQTTKDVDIVSGATYSSKAILRGVKTMLRQAAKNPSDKEDDENEDEGGTENGDDPGKADPSPDEEDENGGNGEEEEEPAAGYGDGTYVAEADCIDQSEDPLFEYTVKTTIVIENGKIVSIDVERINDNSEDPDNNTIYLNYAVNGRTRKGVEYKSIISQILDKQGTGDIDVVSGATYSSKAIIESVKKALEKAAAAYTAPGEEGGEGSGTGNTGSEEGGESSGTGNTGSEEGGEGSGAGNTGSEEGGEGSGTGNTGSEEGGEGSGTGNTGSEEGGEGSSTGNTGSEEGGEGSGSGSTEGGNTGETGEGSGSGSTESGETGNTGEGSGTGSTEGGNAGETGEGSETGKTGTEEPQEEKNTNKYLDGTYSATVKCEDYEDDPLFTYKIKVTIVIKDGKITDVSVKKTDDDSEDPESNELYFGYAADGRTKKGKHYDGIPDQIKDHQSSSGLDAISGATYSSKAMIKAAEKALSDAENPDAKGN